VSPTTPMTAPVRSRHKIQSDRGAAHVEPSAKSCRLHSCGLDVGSRFMRAAAGLKPGPNWRESSPDLILTDALGNRWNPRDLAKKTTFVTMWASWCAPCRAELPYVQKLYQRFRNRSDSGGPSNDLSSETHIAPPPGLDNIYIHLPIHEIFGTVIAFCTSLRRCLVFREKSACQIHAARSC